MTGHQPVTVVSKALLEALLNLYHIYWEEIATTEDNSNKGVYMTWEDSLKMDNAAELCEPLVIEYEGNKKT